ncbi:ABC transporter permease [Okibacterium endophyticum]
MTVLTIVGMILAVMLTTGRTVGAEQHVLGSIDSAGTRSIIVRADHGAGITASVLDRISSVEGVEWAAGFATTVDATNSEVRDGTRVPTRIAYGHDLDRLGIPVSPSAAGQLGYASTNALEQLGLVDGVGAVTLTTGTNYGIAGPIDTPDFLTPFEPLVLMPVTDWEGTEAVGLIVVIAKTPELVAPVADILGSVLAAEDPSQAQIHTSEALAQLRGLIQSQLGSFSRGLVLALMGLTGMLVAVLLYGLVMMRRKDFGRRRALGATRSLIVSLLLIQTAFLSIMGIVTGMMVAVVVLLVANDPLPGAAFSGALAVLTLLTTLIAALIPALIASRREPIRELRIA